MLSKVKQVAASCRPVGRMYLPYTSFSNDNGAVTDQQDCVVVLVFSEPVAGLTATQVKVTGPPNASVSAMKLLQGTSSYYHLLISMADSYIGQVNVAIIVSPPSPCCPLNMFKRPALPLAWI